MGTLSSLRGKRVYLDTNLFIYALEGHPQYLSIVTELFELLDSGEALGVTSELTLAETLVRPLRLRNPHIVAAYEAALQDSEALHVAPISRPVLLEAARLRASSSLKLPDAIHAATARLTACSVLLSNDKQFEVLTDVSFLDLSSVASTV